MHVLTCPRLPFFPLFSLLAGAGTVNCSCATFGASGLNLTSCLVFLTAVISRLCTCHSLSLFYPQVKQEDLCENYTIHPTLIFLIFFGTNIETYETFSNMIAQNQTLFSRILLSAKRHQHICNLVRIRPSKSQRLAAGARALCSPYEQIGQETHETHDAKTSCQTTGFSVLFATGVP